VHTIALIGVDGAGKSTQAERLARRLHSRGWRVVSIHPYGRPITGVLFGTQPRQARSQDGPRHSFMRSALALADVTEQALFLWLVRAVCGMRSLAAGQTVVVVSDRSFDDTLVRHARRGALPPAAVRVLRHLVPEADRTVLLAVSPTTAAARDGDHPLVHYRQLAAAYSEAAQRHGWLVLGCDAPADSVEADLASVVG
jgi:dTMP kinase